MMTPHLPTLALATTFLAACSGNAQVTALEPVPGQPDSTIAIVVAAERTSEYVPGLLGKRVAVVTNHTGRIKETLLVDSLLSLRVNVVKVFSPEHGFRGDADAGAHVADTRDPKTGLAVISLYGEGKKPTPKAMEDVDVVLFDLQDVGVRCYTYISTLHYVMEACAEQHKPLIVLDRPNPNGFFVDGPVLRKQYASFVGLHPVPLVHGMTIGEYAGMINGEEWLKDGAQCPLTVIHCTGYDHTTYYSLPVKPSPNLPDMSAVYLYPSLVLFEGTPVSVGRGTGKPFQCIGLPDGTLGNYTFTPRAMPGATDPPYKGTECRGMDLEEYGTFYSRMNQAISLQWLIGFSKQAAEKKAFFSSFFDQLAGSPDLRGLLLDGADELRIRAAWQPGLAEFMKVRAKYLLYPDFHK
ncbi:MAG: DUF1343 domain-containing protein [Flavobacteriales bacterium]